MENLFPDSHDWAGFTAPLLLHYAQVAKVPFDKFGKSMTELITNKKVPECGWSECDIELAVHELAKLDCNNDPQNVGLGERESRFASNLIARRHYRMGHGMGRSGDLRALQPKASGSSLICRLTNYFVLDLLQELGSPSTKACIVLPVATGMSMAICLTRFRLHRPGSQYVIWSRIDQQSCLKCIITAGFTPIVIDCVQDGEQLVTDVAAIEAAINEVDPFNVAAIITTTTCFAPRAPDNIEAVADLCLRYHIPHLVNNAYGIQCPYYLRLIEQASRGRVDVYVSSTDKNFMVPVGGCIIAGFDSNVVWEIGKMYSGRGSIVPSLDVFITLLELGKEGYKALLEERDSVWEYLCVRLNNLANAIGEKVLFSPNNKVSLGFTLNQFKDLSRDSVTDIGAMLFTKKVSGSRVIQPGTNRSFLSLDLENWGMHCSTSEQNYLTVAATIGIKKRDVELFIARLEDVLNRKFREAVMFPVHHMY